MLATLISKAEFVCDPALELKNILGKFSRNDISRYEK